jgi:hypothetical protein
VSFLNLNNNVSSIAQDKYKYNAKSTDSIGHFQILVNIEFIRRGGQAIPRAVRDRVPKTFTLESLFFQNAYDEKGAAR